MNYPALISGAIKILIGLGLIAAVLHKLGVI